MVFTVGRYVTNKGWKAEKGGVRFIQAWHQNNFFIPKEDRPANSRDKNTLENIWIDETTYKDSGPKTLDELRQRLRFAWKNVNIDTFWELIHYLTA